MANVLNMSEKEILSDLLSSEKYASDTYNTWAGECVDNSLRNTFLDILKEEHEIQNDIFVEMQNHGWYPTKPAQQQELNELRQKYCSNC